MPRPPGNVLALMQRLCIYKKGFHVTITIYLMVDENFGFETRASWARGSLSHLSMRDTKPWELMKKDMEHAASIVTACEWWLLCVRSYEEKQVQRKKWAALVKKGNTNLKTMGCEFGFATALSRKVLPHV
eukprot:scaffold140151_cov20-Tisochrysis_lutea.AAC.1